MKKTTDRHYNYQAIELTEENQATTKQPSPKKKVPAICHITAHPREQQSVHQQEPEETSSW
jgi:hypothetical protein